MTADTITEDRLAKLESSLIIHLASVRRIKRQAANGDISPAEAAAEIRLIASAIAIATK